MHQRVGCIDNVAQDEFASGKRLTVSSCLFSAKLKLKSQSYDSGNLQARKVKRQVCFVGCKSKQLGRQVLETKLCTCSYLPHQMPEPVVAADGFLI